jgi:glutamyl-tRNA synthetase
MTAVRLRFAPSPTGELHVGGLRTALFNYLFARRHGGTFILRIEDTDRERYVEGAERGIVDMLRWAGLEPDEGPHRGGPVGPYRQSERLAHYREAAERLVAGGHAYRCYVSPTELEQMRSAQIARGEDARYDGRHRDLTPEQRARFEAEGRKPVIRMRIPDGDERVVVDDLVRGQVAFSSTQLDDQVLIKSDGFPTYHLAVVVDDHLMGITHVLRAEEWLPSTPKHLYLYRWLGWQPPQHAHLPLLLNEDRSKMSKRSGDTAAEDYRAKGYLPDALVNFLALLGWNPGDDQELFTRAELIEKFSIERVGKAGSVFDRKKLDWMNQVYIGRLPPEALFEALRPYLARTPYAGEDEATLRRICRTVQPSLVTLADIERQLPYFFRPDDAPLAPDVAQGLAADEARTVVAAFRDKLAAQDHLDEAVFKSVMKEVQQSTKVKGKGLWGPVRWAITLEAEGPDLAQVAAVLGRERALARLERVLGG